MIRYDVLSGPRPTGSKGYRPRACSARGISSVTHEQWYAYPHKVIFQGHVFSR